MRRINKIKKRQVSLFNVREVTERKDAGEWGTIDPCSIVALLNNETVG